MGIARAIERVKRQARQGGLHGVMAGLGEELRSSQIPAPLRGAAQRIAALLESGRGPTGDGGASARSSGGGREPARGASAAEQPAVTVYEVSYVEQSLGTQGPAKSAELVPNVGSTPSAGTSATASDSGAAPEPGPSDEGTPVDPAAVGATPSISASPVEVEPVDASPIDVAPADLSPEEVAVADPGGDGEPRRAAELEPTDAPDAPPRRAPGTATAGQKRKEDLAPAGEAAKTLARSTSRGGKKRSGSKANKTSKKS